MDELRARTGILLLATAALATATACQAAHVEDGAVPARSDDPRDAAPRARVDAAPAAPHADAAPATPDAAPAIPDIAPAIPDAAPANPLLRAYILPAAVPVIAIDVGKPIDGRAEVVGKLRLLEPADPTSAVNLTHPPSLESGVAIRLRGNSSFNFPKKSYGLELRDPSGESRALPLLGLPPESDWVLYACYSDKTCLRNMLAYTIAQSLRGYHPRARFVELYLDGKYVGLYNLIEKVKRDRHRVDVPSPSASAADGDVTGGYIVKRDGPGDGPGTTWTSARGDVWTYHFPKETVITPRQRSYIQGYIDAFAAAAEKPGWRDPDTGYGRWMDVPSAVDVLLLSELTKNVDAYRRSAYFTKQPDAAGGRLVVGPVWDFDLAYGNTGGDVNNHDEWWSTTAGWVHQTMKGAKSPENPPAFWYQLLEAPPFQKDLRCRWEELRRTVFSRAAIQEAIDRWVALIAPAERRDHERWPVIGKRIWPNFYVGATYADEVDWLRRWLDARLVWMDASLAGVCR